MDINSVNPLYLVITRVDGDIEEKGTDKYLVFDSTDEKKKKNYLKTIMMFLMGLEIKSQK